MARRPCEGSEVGGARAAASLGMPGPWQGHAHLVAKWHAATYGNAAIGHVTCGPRALSNLKPRLGTKPVPFFLLRCLKVRSGI